jgi:hypothetical protein
MINLDVGDHVEDIVFLDNPAGELLVEGLLLSSGGLATSLDDGVEGVGLLDGVGVSSEELANDAGGLSGETSWLDDGDGHGFLAGVASDHENGIADLNVSSLVVAVGVSVGDEGEVAEGLDAGKGVLVGSVLLGAGKVDSIDVEGDDSAFWGGELDLVHDDVSVGLVLDSESRVSLDLESAGSIGEKGELGIGFGGEVEADGRLALGRDHEVGITVGRAVVVVVIVVIVVVVVIVVIVVGVVLLASFFLTLKFC